MKLIIRIIPDNVGQINKNVTKIKIYQAPKDYVLNKGYDVNTNQLIDVTEQFKDKITYGTNDSVNVDFGSINNSYVWL